MFGPSEIGDSQPVEIADGVQHVLEFDARAIERADDRTRAHARDHINRNLLAFQHAQHAEMRGTPRAAAAQRQADCFAF